MALLPPFLCHSVGCQVDRSVVTSWLRTCIRVFSKNSVHHIEHSGQLCVWTGPFSFPHKMIDRNE